MSKVELQFMVVPEELAKLAYVPNAVKVRIVDPEAIFLTGLLGESGRKLVAAGILFYFERSLAEKLIGRGIAEAVREEEPRRRPIKLGLTDEDHEPHGD